MQVLFDACAGLDVHKKTVVACALVSQPAGPPQATTRTFGTTTAELLALSDWLTTLAVTHVAMESTGVYWKPVFNLLEGSVTVWVLNAQHVKNVPGRKTDVGDAHWLADLLRHGLVQPSFIPPQPQRDLRELTRERTNFVRTRATLVNRLQKVLESANIKLGDVATDIVGRSGRAMLAAIVAGETDGAVLAELAQGRLRSKRAALTEALTGRVRAHHCFLLRELLCQLDSLEETLAAFETQIQAACTADAEVIALVDGIPGFGRELAEVVVAELGTNMEQFPTPAQAAAWAGVAPGNNESAGKRRSGKTRKGNVWLKVALVQAARSAVHSKETYLAAQYRRIARRRGDKRAILAVAHKLLIIVYHVIKRREPYHELGADYFERRKPDVRAKSLVRQIERLGFQVTLLPLTT